MLTKVSLIVAILAGLGALAISHLQVAEKISGLKTELETTSNSLKTAQEAEVKAQKEAKTAKENADKTAKELAETSANLETATSKANTQEARANRAEGDLNKTRSELTEAQRDLAAWKALGRPVDQIERSLAELVRANVAIDALAEEKKVLSRKINTLEVSLDKYEGQRERLPDLPTGLKGKVIAVDPKWDFVVLDIGRKQGLVERGELLVNREGKLVAKVKITRVDDDRAIANVLPAWKQSDVLEGDQVLH